MREVEGVVLSNCAVAAGIYEMRLLVPDASDVRPGQFLNLSSGEGELLLRRPLGIARHGEDCVTVCYQVKGRGTKALSCRVPGDRLSLLMPLGNGFYVKDSERRIALVGGGVGVFPLLSVAEAYRDREVSAYLGFRNRAAVCYEEEFRAVSRLTIGTDDGSAGEKKNAVELFLADYEREKPDVILSCGPPVMLRALKRAIAERGIQAPCYVSLEERMGCGIGACLVCVCDLTNGEHARVCKDGPVFEIGEVEL